MLFTVGHFGRVNFNQICTLQTLPIGTVPVFVVAQVTAAFGAGLEQYTMAYRHHSTYPLSVEYVL
jgi:hypothetical protein